MKVAEQIRNKIKSIPESEPFGYADLGIAADDFVTAAKALERMQKKGTIKKISKGMFYKPEMSIFGELPPKYNAILEKYLFQNNKRVGYITGYLLYNQLNLTTQIAARTKVSTNRPLKKIELSWLKVDAVNSYVTVTKDNYKLLGYLDVLKDIKKIPDCSADNALKILMPQLKKMNSQEWNDIAKFSLKYPARVRALLGAIIEQNFPGNKNIDLLKKSLNPTTVYKIRLGNSLPNKIKWKIV